MRLIPCVAPTGPLDVAPRTALLRDLDVGLRWEGFWSSSSDAYYARCTTGEGAVEWYQMADETAASETEILPTGNDQLPVVLPIRSDSMRRVSLILAASPSGRPMLVGSGRRAVRQ
jgi:hypothetical protein